MKQLSSDNLRTLVAVIELGGYAKAGELLGRSQPAISLQIRKLEDQLNRKLFAKQGQRHIANADGQQLYQYAKQILAINDEVFRIFTQSQLRGQICLGIPSEFATTVLPGIIGDFNKSYPDVTLEVTSALSNTLLAAEGQRHYDLILALTDDTDSNELSAVMEDELVWVGRDEPSFDQKHLSLVAAPNGCIYRKRAINRLNQNNIKWRISYTNADLSGITAALKEGLGITVLAKSTVPSELNILRHKSLPPLGKVGISLLNQSSKHPEASARLAQFIRARLG